MKGKVLIYLDWFEPAFKAGGPIQSIRGIISLVNADFRIVTRSKDKGDNNHLKNMVY